MKASNALNPDDIQMASILSPFDPEEQKKKKSQALTRGEMEQ